MANLSNINGKFVVEQTTGFVGVGTTDPSYPIEVLNASAEIALNASGGSIYRLQSDSASNFIIRKEGVGDRLVINSGGNATFAAKVFSTSTVSGDIGTTLVTKDYVDSGDGSSINTILITVVAVGGANKYFLDGVQQANAVLQPGFTYRFDQSNSSNNGHPLRFSSDAANSSPYTTGVTAVGTPGSAGAYTQIITTQATPVNLYYYCTIHSGMGSAATIRIIKTDGNATFANNVSLIKSSSATGSSTSPKILIYNEGSGDSALQLSVSGSIDYYLGVDNSDNRFKIGGSSWDSSPYLDIDTSGNSTFAGVIFANKTLEVLGQNLTHGASRIKICQENTTTSQIRYYGANTSTKGILQFMSTTSDGSATLAPLTLNADGSSTFAGNVTANNITLDNILLTPAVLPAINTPSISLRNTNNEVYFQAGSANVFNFIKADYGSILTLDGSTSATFAAAILMGANPITNIGSIGTNVYKNQAGDLLFQQVLTTGTPRALNLRTGSPTSDPSSVDASEATGITWGQRTDNNPYYIIKPTKLNLGGGNYSKLTLNWHTGIRIGAQKAYGGTKFYNDAPDIVGEGGVIMNVGVATGNIGIVNSLTVGGSVSTNNIITTAGSLIINDPLDTNSNLIIAGRYDLGATTLSFRSGHGGGNTSVWDMATILVEDDTSFNGRIMFRTSPAGYGNTPTTKMTIRSSGAVAFGTGISDYGSSGQVLTSNGNASPSWQAAGGSSPWSATGNDIYNNNSGNTGIGTGASPIRAKLHVRGDAQIGGASNINGTKFIDFDQLGFSNSATVNVLNTQNALFMGTNRSGWVTFNITCAGLILIVNYAVYTYPGNLWFYSNPYITVDSSGNNSFAEIVVTGGGTNSLAFGLKAKANSFASPREVRCTMQMASGWLFYV